MDSDSGSRGGTGQPRRMLKWLVVSVLVALLAYFAFQGYFSPELLLHFSSSFYC